MRPVVVKSPGFLQHVSKPLSSRRAAPPKSGGLRRRRARDAENHPTRRARWSPCVHTIMSWRLRLAGAMAPTLLLSVAVRSTAHQRLMHEAWMRAPLLEHGVTWVNPSSIGRSSSSWIAYRRPLRRPLSPPAVSVAPRLGPSRSLRSARGQLINNLRASATMPIRRRRLPPPPKRC